MFLNAVTNRVVVVSDLSFKGLSIACALEQAVARKQVSCQNGLLCADGTIAVANDLLTNHVLGMYSKMLFDVPLKSFVDLLVCSFVCNLAHPLLFER